jgi:hypothetical protein
MAIWFTRAALAGLVVCVTAGSAAAAPTTSAKADTSDPWSWWQGPLQPDTSDPWSEGRSVTTSRPRARLDRSDPWAAGPASPPAAPPAPKLSPSPQEEVKASLKQAIDAGDLDRAAELLKKLRSMTKPR